MKTKTQLPLTRKLALAIVVTGLVPAILIGVLAIRTTSRMADAVASSYESDAKHLADKIDRNLFERYGDVQAFGVNDAVNDKKSWYAVGSEKNRIANAANNYANLYGFYLLSYMVDLDGKVVAVNDKDPTGKPIDSKAFYEKNFKDAEWFKEALAGHFLKSDTLDGTFVQSVQVDEDVKKIYGNDGLVLGFTAPVKDASGKTIGVWHNCANFSLVEEIVASAYERYKKEGLPSAGITVVDNSGRVIVDYNPAANGGKETAVHDPNVLLKANLAEQGFAPAARVITGNHGHGFFPFDEKKIMLAAGFSPCNGELGFPGLKWGVIVRVPKADALAAATAQLYQIIFIVAASVAALIFVGVWLGRSILRPLVSGIATMREVGAQVAESAGLISSTSQTVAESASSQAASLEETSASLEEISSMTKRNAENTLNCQTAGERANADAAKGLERVTEMGRTLTAIKGAVADMESAVREMQGSSQEIAKIIKTIDEIAFQTNLLALNAAVEAARAGEAGMGFAVVADEVRALAQRSAQAARDTSDKIESAIKRSALGGAASAKVVKNLAEVEGNARNIEQAFNGIVAQIKSLNGVIGEITGASQEQSSGIAEVNMAVGQMDKVTQRNAAQAEENAGAAAELREQVETLRHVVGDLQSIAGVAKMTRPAAEKIIAEKTPAKARAVPAVRPRQTTPTGNGHVGLGNSGFKDF